MIRTSTKGIFQSDVLIAAAITTGFEEFTKKPWLLDYAFAWLPDDALSRDQRNYGVEGLQNAKDWILANGVTISMAYRTDRPRLPAIGIELLDSTEAQATLGDVHHDTSEDVAANDVLINPQVALGPFTPKSYDSTSGMVVLPDPLTTTALFPGLILFDAVANKGYPIIEILNSNSFSIDLGIKANFTRAYIAKKDNFLVVPLHSLLFRETYRITCYVQSNPAHLLFLHSALMFVLLRKKEQLLEGRGFENFTITSGGVNAISEEDSQPIFSRSVNVTGQVRHYWPGEPSKKLDGIILNPIRIIGDKSPDGIISTVAEQGWAMDGDGIGPG
jgi:hypothetical protein